MPVCTSRSVGAYVASETSVLVWGRQARPATRAVINLQGSHGLADSLKGDSTAELLAAAGFVVVGGDLSQTASQGTFGNNTSITRVGQLVTYVQGTAVPVPAAGKVHLFGASGGCTAAINWARQNPSSVASMYLVAPLVDVADAHDNNRGGYATEIETAYGGAAAYAAAMPTNNPSATGNQAALSGVPMKLVYSTDDPLIPVATVTTYAALVNAAGGSAVTASQGAVGHSANGLDRSDVLQFFREHP